MRFNLWKKAMSTAYFFYKIYLVSFKTGKNINDSTYLAKMFCYYKHRHYTSENLNGNFWAVKNELQLWSDIKIWQVNGKSVEAFHVNQADCYTYVTIVSLKAGLAFYFTSSSFQKWKCKYQRRDGALIRIKKRNHSLVAKACCGPLRQQALYDSLK